jgi:hypothetical protein
VIPTSLRIAAALAAFAGIATPVQAKIWKEIYPIGAGTTRTIKSEGVSVTVAAPQAWSEDEDIGATDGEEVAEYEDAAITVSFPGMAPVSVPPDPFRSAYYGISVGIGKLRRKDAQPTVFLAGYSGGAHCCGTLQLVSAIDGVPVITSLPLKDGDPMSALPKDIDGDGTADIRWGDDSLLYEFSSYAESLQVPQIYNLREGLAYDVSREPRFAGTFRKFAAEALERCAEGEFNNNGGCAAYAYAMAVLGRAEEGIATAAQHAQPSTWLPSHCPAGYDENGECPEGGELTFTDFETALRWIMTQNGYLE